MEHRTSRTARKGRAPLIAVVATAATIGMLAAAQPAAAQVTTTGVVVGGGVLVGNVVQIPVTAVVGVQVCNNAISIGLIGIPANVLGSAACGSADPAVLGAAPRRGRSTATQRHRRARHARSARGGTRRGG